MKRSIVCGGLGVLALATSACALSFDSTQLGVPTSLAEAATEQPQGTEFRVTKHPVYFFWGAVGVSHPRVEDVLGGQVGLGGRLANVRIRIRSRWSDVLITALTAGIIAPRSVTFEGVIVPH